MSISMHHSTTARDRLIETARQLYLAHGVPHVGINRVIKEAGIARMTLYNHFASKDDLVAAAFEQEVDLRRQSITSVQEELDDPLDKVLALFVVALELARQSGFRGCAFINLAIEVAAPDSALHGIAKAHKDWILTNIAEHLPPETFADPDMLARQILVLWDGSILGAYVHQTDAPIHAARQAARDLMRGAAS